MFFSSLTSAANEELQTNKVLVLYGGADVTVFQQGFNAGFLDYIYSVNAERPTIQSSSILTALNFTQPNERPDGLIAELRYKQDLTPADLVISVMPLASSFLAEYGEEIYPGRKKIYALPGLGVAAVHPDESIPSAAEEAMRETLKIVPSLIPDIQHLYVITGNSPLGRIYLDTFKSALKSQPPMYSINYLIALPREEMLSRLEVLPEKSAVFFLFYQEDFNRQSYRNAEIARLVSLAASGPVFGFYDALFGGGIVGGPMTGARSYGERSAQFALAMLGIKDDLTPISLTTYRFDSRQLDRWQISRDQLPGSSIVEFDVFIFFQ